MVLLIHVLHFSLLSVCPKATNTVYKIATSVFQSIHFNIISELFWTVLVNVVIICLSTFFFLFGCCLHFTIYKALQQSKHLVYLLFQAKFMQLWLSLDIPFNFYLHFVLLQPLTICQTYIYTCVLCIYYCILCVYIIYIQSRSNSSSSSR